MGSKRHSRRDSSYSDESDSSGNPKKKHSKTCHLNDEDTTAKTMYGYSESGRTRSSSSGQRGSSKYTTSRSRSHDRKTNHRDRSHSKNRSQSKDSRRDANRESGCSRFARVNHKKYSKEKDYDLRFNHSDKRKEEFTKEDNMNRSRSRSFDHANAKWGKSNDQSKDKKKEMENKAKPNFALSGKLTEETNSYRGVVIKYSEPPEARKPRRRWRLYPFKGDKALQTLYIHRESAYLIGRDRKVVDLPVDHPSCSKQHAALQYRLVPFTRDNGSVGKRVRPYLIDLDSANGTFINNKRMDARKYVELLERDVIKFGFSSREYVLLHENSKDEALDDDVKLEDEGIKEELDVKEEQD